MAVLLSKATGDFTAATTWALIDSASYLNSNTGVSTPPTSAGTTSRSAAFTPAASTLDGIAIKLASRTGTTGTVTVALVLSSDNVVQRSTTLDMADIPAAVSTEDQGGWIFFKFASSITVDGATAYKVDVLTSSATQISLNRDATTNNWSRMLRTTTAQAPAASDDLVVAGEHTGQGTGNDLTVTMNETAATDYGSNTTTSVTPALAICKRGTLTFKDTSAANPKLRLSGFLFVYIGGTLNIGTTGQPIPRDSTAILEFDCGSDGAFGLLVRGGGTFNAQGLSRTSGKAVVKCLLSADVAASGAAPSTSSLTVDTDTGWLSGDQIAVAATTRTATQCETATLTADAGASSMTINNCTAGVADQAYPLTADRGCLNAHSGTSPTQAAVILLTRNVKIRSVSAANMSFVNVKSSASVDIDWVEFYYLGDSAADKQGISVQTTTGSFAMHYSSLHDCRDNGLYFSLATLNNVTVAHNTMWCLATVTGPAWYVVNATSGTNITFDNNTLIRTVVGSAVQLNDLGLTFTNNRVVGAASSGIILAEGDLTVLGLFKDNVTHSNTGNGVNTSTGSIVATLENHINWRNNSSGFSFFLANITLISPIAFGNSNANLTINSGGSVAIRDGVFNGDTTFATTSGVELASTCVVTLDNCDFSTVSGIKTAHTNDISVANTQSSALCLARNCKLGGTNEVSTQTRLTVDGAVSSQKNDQTAGNHKTWLQYGTLSIDTTIYNTAAPSLRLTPSSATGKLPSASRHNGMKIAAANGQTVTVSANVRKSASGDGAAYNGNQPRLIQRCNPAIGVNADTVLDTMTVGTGTWETLSGTTAAVTDDGVVEVVVDIDGTAGWANVDDFSVT